MAKKVKYTWIKANGATNLVRAEKYPKEESLYLFHEPNSFNGIITYKEEYDKKDLKTARKIIDKLVDEINFVKNRDILDNSYEGLKSSSNITDILLILSNLKIFYNINSNKYPIGNTFTLKDEDFNKLDQISKTNPEMISSLLIKKIIHTYCYNKINDLGFEKIKELYDYTNTFPDSESVYCKAGFKFDDIDFNNLCVATKNELISVIREVFIDRAEHLCFSCRFASTDKCDKIFDPWDRKKNINEYDFIIDGYQTYIDDKMEKFTVTKCANFKPDEPNKRISGIKATQIRKNLKMFYFDAETIEEANDIEKQLVKKGQLRPSNGHSTTNNK